MGDISEKAIKYLESKGINIGHSDIELTYGDLTHSQRPNKNPLQKASKEQAKRVVDIIKENNVFYDVNNKNLIYISKLPPEEIKGDRDWIKIPIYFDTEKNMNRIITISIIPSNTIIKSPLKYEKID